MRVEPLMQLNEGITSIVETVAYTSFATLTLMLLVAAAIELRSRIRPAGRKRSSGDSRGTVARHHAPSAR